MRVAIVGAGIAGLACADRLHETGHDITLFDKARGAETSNEEPTVEAKDQPAPVKKLQSSTEQHPEDDATFSSDDQPESPAIKQIRQRMDESKVF